MAQYESGSSAPKADLVYELAKVLEVSPKALTLPYIESYDGIMRTLFTLENCFGLTVEKNESGIVTHIDPRKGKDAAELCEMVIAWAERAEQYHNGEITREEYGVALQLPEI